MLFARHDAKNIGMKQATVIFVYLLIIHYFYIDGYGNRWIKFFCLANCIFFEL